jgi:hypothetical protein
MLCVARSAAGMSSRSRPGGELVVEIMTPHFNHYFHDGQSPHDAGKPTPIPFLAVPARSEFRFIVTCNPARLPADCPDWKTVLDRIVSARLRLAGLRRQDGGRLRRDGGRSCCRGDTATGTGRASAAGLKQRRRPHAGRRCHPKSRNSNSRVPSIARLAQRFRSREGKRQVPGRLVADRRNRASATFQQAIEWRNPGGARRGGGFPARSHQVDRLARLERNCASSSSRTGSRRSNHERRQTIGRASQEASATAHVHLRRRPTTRSTTMTTLISFPRQGYGQRQTR